MLRSFLFIVLVTTLVSAGLAQTKTIVAFGDSITAKRDGVLVYSELIKAEFEKKGVPVNIVNSGIGGNTTDHAKARFEKDVLAHKPDLVIIQFGTNDSAIDVWRNPPAVKNRVDIKTFESNLRRFISELKKINAKIILVAPSPMRWTDKLKEMYGKPPYRADDADGFNATLKPYVERVKKIAKSEKVTLIDLNKAYYDYHNTPGQTMDDLFTDGMHPNNKGQAIEAELLLKELKKMDLGL